MDDGGQRENGRHKLDYYKGPQNPVGKATSLHPKNLSKKREEKFWELLSLFYE